VTILKAISERVDSDRSKPEVWRAVYPITWTRYHQLETVTQKKITYHNKKGEHKLIEKTDEGHCRRTRWMLSKRPPLRLF